MDRELNLVLYDVTTLYFEGNKAETKKTISPVIKTFQFQHGLDKITVVADVAILSEKNLSALAGAGYHYIVDSQLQKIPFEIAEYQKTQELEDEQIVVSHYEAYRVKRSE